MQASFSRAVDVLVITLACCSALAFAPRANAGAPASQPDSPSPDPKLKPQDVVKIVIEALSKNDADDNGIRTTWKFASPGNQSMTGPVERFIPMVKGPPYGAMINSKSAEYAPPDVKDDEALELVVLTAADGTKSAFVFHLSKQGDGPLKDCWMTDGVFPVKPRQGPGNNGGDNAGDIPV